MPVVGRRAVLAAIGATAVAPLMRSLPHADLARPVLVRGLFSGSVGTRVTAAVGGAAISLIIETATDLQSAPEGDGRRFSVLFRQDGDEPLGGPLPAGGIYRVELPTGGVDLALFPVGRPSLRRLEAVLNQ